MELRPLARTGVRVAELALGTMTFGRETPEDESRRILDRYLEAGGNFVDTADVYGGGASEEILGRALGPRREAVVLATKFRMDLGTDVNDRGASRRHLRRQVESSLRRLRTDRIDLYQVHCWDDHTRLEDTLSTLDDLVHEGKVRYIGASNYAGWHLAEALGLQARHGWEPFCSIQVQYSLLTRGIEREVLPCATSHGLAVLPWSPLGGGLLTGKYRPDTPPPPGVRASDPTPSATLMRQRITDARNHRVAECVRAVAADCGRSPAQVALNWVLHRPGVTAPLLGARSLAQLEDNLGATGWRLDDGAIARLEEASREEPGYPYDFITWVHTRS
jgi:aryl-alcohol dehydrogenase-like predicted oxidoreductase